ncbi:HAMP domain-containing sensor histidine kinase [Bacillus carboniphilus]|uniref:Heme sensor protein HssS n=1 Tax=Bacillus carboniphilus TaxID=86663 RepID=A0ABY9JUK2_9BACI|nr:HAMP domain-containing sensor histidine kinase [Bacillus carboniphilus]WLR41356.1 HAMP domain-containing sensor histidine kinase [Bacillus carboniphilus]
MKNIHTQFIITFLFAALSSLILAFLIAIPLFEQSTYSDLHEEMEELSEVIIHLYEVSPEGKIEVYISKLDNFNYQAILFDESEEIVRTNGSTWFIKDQQVQHVLQGNGFTLEEERPRVLGIPFQVAGMNYALFLRPNFSKVVGSFKDLMIIIFFTIFIVGNIIFYFLSRYLVRPIHDLTGATQKVSEGNFNISLKIKRKDEMGDLISNFNYMVEELGKVDEMRQRFVSDVSHEIQSPLTSIQGFAKALKNGVVSSKEDQVHYLSVIEKESQRLSSLSENLLKLSVMDTDGKNVKKERYSLDEQLRRVVISLGPQWTRKKQVINIDCQSVSIMANQELLEQVWVNLLTNAIRYTGEGESISIGLIERGERAIITIKDTGIGMEQDELRHIFKRFYKIDPFRSGRGSGLGLSIVAKILDNHDGKVEVDSEKGVGTCFTVILPNARKES